MNDVQTTEATGKKWKAVQLLGGLAGLVGLAIGTLGVGILGLPRDPVIFVAGWSLGLVGLLALLVGKLGAWWYHA